MWLLVMFYCNRSVLYEQIITILQYAVNFYGSSHITKKRRPCERAPVRHEETNHISCLNQLQELVDEKMVPRCGYGMPAIHLAASQHPSRRLVKRQNIHLTASQKWQKSQHYTGCSNETKRSRSSSRKSFGFHSLHLAPCRYAVSANVPHSHIVRRLPRQLHRGLRLLLSDILCCCNVCKCRIC